MVLFLTTLAGAGHIEGFIKRYDRAYAKELFGCTYAAALRRGRLPSGCAYVFCDAERMGPRQRALAAELWRQLEEGGSVRLLNHPQRQLDRRSFLRRLWEEGINQFNVFRLEEVGPELRFPAFLRLARDHDGPRTDLLHSWTEMEREAARLILAGARPEEILVTEFVETDRPLGHYEKFGAFRIGDAYFGQHRMLASHWSCKRATTIRNEGTGALSDAYFRENPHGGMLAPIFDLANVEYGRVDFSFRQGRMQVWEINDNPMTLGRNPLRLSKERKDIPYMKAMRRLAEGLEDTGPIRLVWPALREVART